MNYEGLVYIEPATGYYARYEVTKDLVKKRRVATRTHAFNSDEPLTPYWIEVMRQNPKLLEGQDANE